MKRRDFLQPGGLTSLQLNSDVLEGEFAKLAIPVLNQVVRPFTGAVRRRGSPKAALKRTHSKRSATSAPAVEPAQHLECVRFTGAVRRRCPPKAALKRTHSKRSATSAPAVEPARHLECVRFTGAVRRRCSPKAALKRTHRVLDPALRHGQPAKNLLEPHPKRSTHPYPP